MTGFVSECPQCGSTRNYLLKDNRLLCADCRKKFSESHARARVATDAISAICTKFLDRAPAAVVAQELNINRKTVQRYYDLFRGRICEEADQLLLDRFGRTSVGRGEFHREASLAGEPIFCVAQANGATSILFSEDEEDAVPGIVGWVYAHNLKASEDLDLDRIHYAPVNGNQPREENFWVFAKKGLAAYHGGFKRNFRSFIREMEFRYNHRQRASACELLRQIVLINYGINRR